jgi:hypothetical protein
MRHGCERIARGNGTPTEELGRRGKLYLYS